MKTKKEIKNRIEEIEKNIKLTLKYLKDEVEFILDEDEAYFDLAQLRDIKKTTQERWDSNN